MSRKMCHCLPGYCLREGGLTCWLVVSSSGAVMLSTPEWICAPAVPSSRQVVVMDGVGRKKHWLLVRVEGWSLYRVAADTCAVSARVLDYIADVTVVLVYKNNTRGIYENPFFDFPLEDNGSTHTVYRCTAKFSDSTRREAVHLDKDTTIKKMWASDAQGMTRKRTMSKDGHFRCGIGDLARDAFVEIILSFTTHNSHISGGSQIRIPALHKADDATFSFECVIKSGFPIENINADTRNAAHTVTDAETTKVTVERIVQKSTPCSPVILHIDYQTSTRPSAFLLEGAHPAGAEGRLVMVTNPASRTPVLLSGTDALIPVPCTSTVGASQAGDSSEFYFVIDQSGSMRGEPIEHARQTLLLFVKSLPVGCHFNIIGFGFRYTVLFSHSPNVAYDEMNLSRACEYQRMMQADLGGTKLYEPLSFLFKHRTKAGCTRHIFVLTDGKVENRDDVIQLVKKKLGNSHVHAFGIGTRVDRQLVTQLAAAGQGQCHFIEDTNTREMESKVISALRDIHNNSMRNPQVQWQTPASVTMEPLPETIWSPNQHLHFFVINGQEKMAEKSRFIKGNMTSSAPDVAGGEVTLNLAQECNMIPGVHHLLARQKIKDMERLLPPDGQDPATAGRSMVELSERWNVPSSMTLCTTHFYMTRFSDYMGALVINCINGEAHPPPTRPPAIPVPVPVPVPVPATPPPAPVLAHPLRRQYHLLRDNMLGCLTKSTIRRLARRGGTMAISSLSYDEVRYNLRWFLQNIVKDCVALVDHRCQKTITPDDVEWALRNNGIKMYGTGGVYDLDQGPCPRKVYTRTSPVKPRTGKPQAGAASSASVRCRGDNASSSDEESSDDPDYEPGQASPTDTSTTDEETVNLQHQGTIFNSTASPRLGSRVKASTASCSAACRSSSSSADDVSDSNSDTAPPPGKKQRIVQTRRSRQHGLATKCKSTTSQADGASTSGSHPVPPSVNSRRMAQMRRTKRGSKVQKTSAGTDHNQSTLSRQSTSVVVAAPSIVRSMNRGASMTRSRRSSLMATKGTVVDFTHMVQVITLQTFDGSWDLSKALATIMGRTLNELTQKSATEALKPWATALAMTWMQKHFAASRTEWDLVEYKGMNWLASTNLSPLSSTDELMRAATQFWN